jgi:hypothetical protein
MIPSTVAWQGKSIHSTLERQFINDYLSSQGYRAEDLHLLPNGQRRALLAAASRYASLKLAEIESRSRFIDKIHYEE